MQVVKNGSTFNGKPLIMKWYHTPKITPKIPSPTSGSMHSSSPVPQHRQLPFKEKSIPASPSSDEPVCWTVWAMYAHVVCYRVVHHGINTLSGLAITFTVICYIFFVKIFSYTENHTKIFMRINSTTKIFQRWLAPCFTPALPELLLPIYPCIRGSL